MIDLKKGFDTFLVWALRILILFIIGGTIVKSYLFDEVTKFSLVLIVLSILFILGIYISIKKDVNKVILMTFILIIALVVRLLWFYNIDSIPVGDFNRMFICAGDFLSGTTYMFKGTAYMGRFPHMTITVLYFALIRNIFSNPLVAIKLINIIFSMINVVLLYFLGKEVFRSKEIGIGVMAFAAIFPPMIIYNNVFCSENMAIPLLIISVLMILKGYKSNNLWKTSLLICGAGIFLSLAQLFRPVGYVVIVAYIMYIFIYFKEGIKLKVLGVINVILSFILPWALVSYLLIALNITEYPLWHGTEPLSISMLKGTNIESQGRWNEEDSAIFNKYDGDYEKVDEEAKSIIKERLTETPKLKLLTFYITKFMNEWNTGDFAGAYWAENGLDEGYNREEYLNMLGKTEGKMLIRMSTEGIVYTKFFWVFIVIMTYIGLYRNRLERNYSIDLFYIIFGGASLFGLITEFQDRYTYPYSWIFIILAFTAFNFNKKENRESIFY